MGSVKEFKQKLEKSNDIYVDVCSKARAFIDTCNVTKTERNAIEIIAYSAEKVFMKGGFIIGLLNNYDGSWEEVPEFYRRMVLRQLKEFDKLREDFKYCSLAYDIIKAK